MKYYARGALPEETSIYTAEMTAIKIAMKEIKKREDMKWVLEKIIEP